MTSRLEQSASPYLRAHATNPVAWFAWGEAAFEAARSRDVPVLISIGYATCHWCHVMARESFADDATAALINAEFVSIKVDREEHPEVDETYMAAAAAFTQNLGWPLTIFATPDGRTFHAGTYWPAESTDGRPAFRDVLTAVAEAWRDRRDGALRVADSVQAALRDASSQATPLSLTRALLDEAALAIAATEDPRHGGLGTHGPKFPIATALQFLQDRDTPPKAAALVPRALTAMRISQLFDEVDGGFFRYATNPDWTEPHYERMLVDNAQLLDVAVAVGDDNTAERIVDFLETVLQQPSGGFAAAQDAESIVHGVPSAGGYYRAVDRSSLEAPSVDAKVVTGWNGLAIGALARHAMLAGSVRARALAVEAALAVIEANTAPDGTLVRSSLDELQSRAHATAADVGELAEGLFMLAGATGEVGYAVKARELLRQEIARDPVLASLGIAGAPAASDGDEPSDAAALARAHLLAFALGAGQPHRDRAAALIEQHGADALAQPRAHGALLRAARMLSRAPKQVVVIGAHAASALALAAAKLAADVHVFATPDQARAWTQAGFMAFEGKDAFAEPTAFVCSDFVCRLPVTQAADLAG